MTEQPSVRRSRTGADDPDLTLQRRFAVEPAVVWAALTDPQRASRWLGPISGAPRAVGDEFDVQIAPARVAHARVESCRAPHDVAFAWVVAGEPRSRVVATVRGEGEGSILTLRHFRLGADVFAEDGSAWENAIGQLAAALGEAAEPLNPEVWSRLSISGLRVVRELSAEPSRVWKAFTTAEGLRTWWWTHWQGVEIVADTHPGGGYRIRAPHQGIVVEGSYLDVEPYRHLSFTWCWTDADGSSADEACDVTFEPITGGTRLVVTHTGPWTGGEAESYRQGWDFTLQVLERVLAPAATR